MKTFDAKIVPVAYSSVVGSSVMVEIDGVGCVALLLVSVPQPHLDYKTVASAVTKALGDKLQLELPDDFAEGRANG